MLGVDIIAAMAVLLPIGILANRHEGKVLSRAPKGAVRVETIKASHLKNKVRTYQRFGWSIVDQSSSKSFGSQPRVTITFRKDAS